MINFASWAFWLVGLLGIGGAIAFVVLAPAVAMPLLQTLWRGFLACTPCQLAALLIIGLVAGDMYGFHKAAVQCHDAELAAEIKAKQRDIDNANQAAADADARANEIAQGAQKKQLEDEAYIDDLKKRPPSGACVLTDDDVRGLRESNSDGAVAQPAARARLHGRH